MSDFKEIMKNRSNAELIEITTTLRHEYQEEAVRDAEIELENRNLGDEELEGVSAELEAKEESNEETSQAEGRLGKWISILDPNAPKSAELTIKRTAAFLTVIFLFIISRYWFMGGRYMAPPAAWTVDSLLYWGPLWALPVGIFGLWATKKYGWQILVILFSYLAIKMLSHIPGLIMTYLTGERMIGDLPLYDYFGEVRLQTLLVRIAFIGFILVTLNKSKVRKKYEVGVNDQLKSFGIGVLLFSIPRLLHVYF